MLITPGQSLIICDQCGTRMESPSGRTPPGWTMVVRMAGHETDTDKRWDFCSYDCHVDHVNGGEQ